MHTTTIQQLLKIRPEEVISWSSKNALLGLVCGFLVGFGIGASFGLTITREVSAILIFGFISAVLFGLIIGLLSGVVGKQLTERVHLSPNEGIWRSARNGLVKILLVVIPYTLFEWLGGRPLDGLYFGLVIGLFVGQFTFIQHFTLRFWLWRSRTFPWKVVPFLEDATIRIFLRRAGGGYSFTHRLLLDHFVRTAPATAEAIVGPEMS